MEKIIINYPYKFKLKPNNQQLSWLKMVGGANRFIFNHYLHKEKVESVSSWCRDLTKLKQDLTWLKSIPSQTLQQKIKDLHLAWDRFFKRLGGKPKSKRKQSNNDSFRLPQGYKIQDNRIFLPKLGWVKFYKSQDINGIMKSVTVKQESDGWYIVVLTQQQIEVTPNGYDPIGLDLGLNSFATLSDGTKFKSPKPLKKYLKKLVREQRKLSSKQKGSNNRNKQRNKVSRIHKKITNIRNDYLHKLSTHLAKNHSQVCVEDLKVSNMVKNHKLARSISDQGWSRFISMLDYKCSWYGSKLIKVDTFFPSSKLCCSCGCKKLDLTLKDRIYICDNCGLIIDRDINAAINILNKCTVGHTETKACGDIRLLTNSMKQEPIRSKRLTALAV